MDWKCGNGNIYKNATINSKSTRQTSKKQSRGKENKTVSHEKKEKFCFENY